MNSFGKDRCDDAITKKMIFVHYLYVSVILFASAVFFVTSIAIDYCNSDLCPEDRLHVGCGENSSVISFWKITLILNK